MPTTATLGSGCERRCRWHGWHAANAGAAPFTAWPVSTHPLGGGRTAARRAHYDEFESITIRVVHTGGYPCLACIWVLHNIDSPFAKADLERLWVHRHGEEAPF